MSSEPKAQTAEDKLRAAFERLKSNKPERLKQGTEVSQNNVAREAGVDPSALRKTRYPGLIREIQAYVEIKEHRKESARQKRLRNAKEKVTSQDRIKQLTEQRDIAQSQLLSAHRMIIELAEENERLKARLEVHEPPPVPLTR